METVNSSHKDLLAISKCHRAAFPESLSSKLGLNYCTNMLSFYLDNGRGLLFHVSDNKDIIGYCGGLMNKEPGQPGSATSMTQHTLKPLVLNLLIRPWLIFHHEIRDNIPLIIKNIKLRLTTVASNNVASSPPPNKEFMPSMGLVVIGVSPEHQGKGYGSLLLEEFESRARKEGFPRMHLSVKKDNSQAIATYKKNGWMVSHEGKNELSMYKRIE